MRDLPAMTRRTPGGQIFGARGDDYLDGGPGDDTLFADTSNGQTLTSDFLAGSAGADWVFAGAGKSVQVHGARLKVAP